MGAYSSWASLALVHHAIVQLSYHSITPGLGKENWFLDYRVLGDDIVIADKAVADAYLGYCALFGIPISPAKGIVSDQGLLNFASQFVQDSLDLSPASLKEELQISSVARRKEMASRLIRRGWARNSLAATLRLMLCPRIWDASMARLAKGKMSFALDMVIRSAFSPKASIIRYFGDSALLVRCWFRALRPGVGILTDLVEMSRGNEERRLSVLPLSEAERLMISKLASLIHADVLSQAERFETDMTQWELNVRPSVGDTYGMHVAYTTWFAFNMHRFAPMRERLDTVLQRANLTAAFLLDLPERVSPKDAIDRLMVLVDCSTEVPSLPRWSSPCPGATEAELYKAQTPEAAFRIACNMERQDWIRDLALLKLKEPHGDRSSYAQPSYFDSFEL
jgi:hypothetical protein